MAFALVELKNRFLQTKTPVSIESFSSYDGLYSYDLSYGKQALLLISASTSANIITYILNRQRLVTRDNIVIMFFLGEEKNYLNIQDQVLCNLTQSPSNPSGIPHYQTYLENNCKFCRDGSYAVEVAGDVFLLENPKVNRIVFKITDPEKNLSNFVQQFMSKLKKDTVIKVNYKENSDSNQKYDVYIDFVEILNGLNTAGRYENFKKKLKDHINQYIPSNTRYLITLNDSASKMLATYISDKIRDSYPENNKPIIITQDQISSISNNDGAAVVVGSCISNGKNLLYISRALRKFDELRIVYFMGISRMKDLASLDFLMKNLKQGSYGSETNSFIEVDRIFCSNESKSTPWIKELDFLKLFLDFILDELPSNQLTINFIRDRKKMIEESAGDHKKGLSEKLFYPRMIDDKIIELEIRKNFAFFNFEKYDQDVTQSEVYFTILNILETLRNSSKGDRYLRQTAFVRNLIDPENFNRFNDGVIQASILRAAKTSELAYSIDYQTSLDMLGTLETLIRYHSEEQGEALIEFIYALACEKMTLKQSHLTRVVELLYENSNNEIIRSLGIYIERRIVKTNNFAKSAPQNSNNN